MTFLCRPCVPQRDHMRFPIRWRLNFEKNDLIYFCRLFKNELIILFEFKKKTEKHLKIARQFCDCRLNLFSLLEVNDAP